MRFRRRPGIGAFLDHCAELYEVVVYTAASKVSTPATSWCSVAGCSRLNSCLERRFRATSLACPCMLAPLKLAAGRQSKVPICV